MTLKEALKEQMKDEAFKKEYELLEPEYKLIRQKFYDEEVMSCCPKQNSKYVPLTCKNFTSNN